MSNILSRYKILRSIHTHDRGALLSRLAFLLCSLLVFQQVSYVYAQPDGSQDVIISRETYSAYIDDIPQELASLIGGGLVEFPVVYHTNRDSVEYDVNLNQILQGALNASTPHMHFESSFFLTKLRDNSPLWSIKGSIARIRPSLSEDKKLSDQFMREKISLLEPSRLRLYTFLTFRFFSEIEDLIWVYSPLIKRDRSVAASIRTDPLFFADITPDDLFTWSGKPDWVDVRVESQKDLFLPIRRINEEWSDHCADSAGIELTPIRWNFNSEILSQRAGWLPVGFSFSQRKTIVLNIVNRDQFSSYGRQTLYLDGESNAPIIKIVYGHDGKIWKVVVSLVEMWRSASKGSLPLYRATLAYDATQNSSTVMVFNNFKSCNERDVFEKLNRFDPTKLGNEGQGSQNKNGTETSVPPLKVKKN